MKALRLPTRVSAVAYWFASTAHAILLRSCSPARSGTSGGPFLARAFVPPVALLRLARAWTRGGSLRSSGDPSRAFAPFQDPGRADVPSPSRSRPCCPRYPDGEGLGRWLISGLTRELRHLLPYASRFALPLACKACFRPAGWPLPGGSRTLWIATKGFSSFSRSSPFLLS